MDIFYRLVLRDETLYVRRNAPSALIDDEKRRIGIPEGVKPTVSRDPTNNPSPVDAYRYQWEEPQLVETQDGPD